MTSLLGRLHTTNDERTKQPPRVHTMQVCMPGCAMLAFPSARTNLNELRSRWSKTQTIRDGTRHATIVFSKPHVCSWNSFTTVPLSVEVRSSPTNARMSANAYR